jgi:hypothetical protein
MTRPEDAAARAAEAAARKRAEGVYPDAAPGALEASITPDRPGAELLAEWAVIQPDLDSVYSTRRLGAPITLFKRLLVRLLRQHHAEIEAKQTRFNVALLARVRELERRLERLERAADEGE